jgi:hypothetical protein
MVDATDTPRRSIEQSPFLPRREWREDSASCAYATPCNKMIDSGINMPSTMINDTQRSICSQASQDQGYQVSPIRQARFNSEIITDIDRAQFAEQDEERQQRHFDLIAEDQRDEEEVWQLADWLNRWVGKCAICYIKKEMGDDIDVRHDLPECPFEKERCLVEDEMQELQIHFQRFSGCVRCMVPQDICNRWELVQAGRRRFKENKMEECQYKDIVKPALAALFITAPYAVLDKTYAWMRSEGVWVGTEERIGEKDVAKVKKKMIIWFGNKVQLGGVELNVGIQAYARMNRWLWAEARGIL